MYSTKNKYTLFILNICIFVSLYFVVYLLFFGTMGLNNPQIINLSRTAAITFVSFSMILAMMHSIYGRINVGRNKRKISNVSTMLSVMFTDVFAYVILQIMNVNPQNNAQLVLFGRDFSLLLLCIVFQFIWIYVVTLAGDRIFHYIFPPFKTCIVTDSQENADYIYSKFLNHSHHYSVREVVHHCSKELENAIDRNDTVILYHLPQEKENLCTELCYKSSKNVLLAPNINSLIVSAANRVVFEDKAFLHINPAKMSFTQQLIKRSIDLVLSAILLIVLSPMLLISALVIKAYDGGPALFIQERETLHGNIFKIFKFRTMRHNIDKLLGKTVSAGIDDDRITKPGKYLRKFRIDELPQLINIFLGHMSFVGPRPEMLENAYRYAEEYPEFKYRLKVKGGLTGLAQIDGKYNTTFEDKLLLDLFYIENYSLGLDIKLMFRTLTVFFRSDSTEGFKDTVCSAPKMIN